jgi:hypothetical protein
MSKDKPPKEDPIGSGHDTRSRPPRPFPGTERPPSPSPRPEPRPEPTPAPTPEPRPNPPIR